MKSHALRTIGMSIDSVRESVQELAGDKPGKGSNILTSVFGVFNLRIGFMLLIGATAIASVRAQMCPAPSVINATIGYASSPNQISIAGGTSAH